MTDPADFCCPLSHQLIEDPVVAADGFTYERSWVEDYLQRQPGKSPMTGQPISAAVSWQEVGISGQGLELTLAFEAAWAIRYRLAQLHFRSCTRIST